MHHFPCSKISAFDHFYLKLTTAFKCHEFSAVKMEPQSSPTNSANLILSPHQQHQQMAPEHFLLENHHHGGYYQGQPHHHHHQIGHHNRAANMDWDPQFYNYHHQPQPIHSHSDFSRRSKDRSTSNSTNNEGESR